MAGADDQITLTQQTNQNQLQNLGGKSLDPYGKVNSKAREIIQKVERNKKLLATVIGHERQASNDSTGGSGEYADFKSSIQQQQLIGRGNMHSLVVAGGRNQPTGYNNSYSIQQQPKPPSRQAPSHLNISEDL